MKQTHIHQDEQPDIDALIRQYGRLLWTVIDGILAGVGTREDVEELVQDVFVQYWQNPQQFDPQKGTLRSYLCMSARCRAIDRLRQLRRHTALPLEELPEPETEDLLLLRVGTADRIQAALTRLPPPTDRIISLRLLYDMKPRDISRKLSIPVARVYRHIRSGKELLRTLLDKEDFYE